jgi:hypothetical protein
MKLDGHEASKLVILEALCGDLLEKPNLYYDKLANFL